MMDNYIDYMAPADTAESCSSLSFTVSTTLSDEGIISAALNDKVDIEEKLAAALDAHPKLGKSNCGKDKEKFLESTNEGDKMNANDDFQGALIRYSKAIRFAASAEEQNCELGTAFGKRAVVWYKLKKYKNCVKDITRAELNGYNIEQCPQLGPILNQCINELGNMKDQEVNQNDHILDCQTDNSCLSQSIRLEVNEERGRHYVASAPIKPGDVVAQEEPYITLMDERFNKKRCQMCFIKCENSFVPCRQCTKVVYCSEHCEHQYWITLHHAECTILPHLYNLEELRYNPASKLALSLRMLLRSSKVLAQWKTSSTETRNELLPVYSLLDKRDVHYQTCLEAAGDVAFVVTLLTNTTFYGTLRRALSPSGSLISESNLNIFIGSMLLLGLRISLVNRDSVRELTIDRVVFTKIISLGDEVSYWISFFNHSCDPNVERVSKGNRMVIRALRPISVGEEIFINYVWRPYHVQTKASRWEILSKNRILDTCNCRPCTEDWGLESTLPKILEHTIKCCDECFVGKNPQQCLKCDPDEKTIKLNEILTAIQLKKNYASDSYLKCKPVEDDIHKVCDYIKVLYQYCTPPSQDMVEAENMLTQLFYLVSDNVKGRSALGFLK